MPNAREHQRRSHICDRCNKAFQRAEHLSRHLLARESSQSVMSQHFVQLMYY
jgi:uncharacterized Zn-finger protein